MKPKTMILMGLAITCGLGASYMTSRLLAERQTGEEPEKVEILVASKTLNVHQRIVKPEDMFEKKLVAKELEPPDAIKDFDALKGKSLKVGRNKGDHITAANLYDKGQLEIPEGYQAVGIRVNIETTASGLASLPGSHVDLLLTIAAQDPRAIKTIVLLETVLVLAADIRVTPEGEIAAPAQVVTFGLKREDVLAVTTAKTMGQITLVLRKTGDAGYAKEIEMTGAKILDKNKLPEPPVVAKVEPKPEPKIVPKVEPKPVPPAPKIVESYYDLIQGTESGPRVVTRVHYSQTEDGEVTVLRTEVLNASTGSQPSLGAPRGPAAPRKNLGGQREI